MKKRELLALIVGLTEVAENQRARIDALERDHAAVEAALASLMAVRACEVSPLVDGAKIAIRSADGAYLSAGTVYGRPMEVVTVRKHYGDQEVFTLELQP